jgi:hypothetical protein
MKTVNLHAAKTRLSRLEDVKLLDARAQER